MRSIGGEIAPLKGLDPNIVLQRFLAEETGKQIAESLGVTRAALSHFMLKYAEQEWKDAQVAKALIRKDRAEDLLETADNALDLTRARELLRSAQWDLERVCRRIYGQDQPPNGAAQVAIQINVRRGEKPLESVEAVVLAAK